MSHQTYAPFRTSFWTDPEVRTTLPALGKYLAGYYFSAPESNLIGLYSAPYDQTAKRTDLPIEVVRFTTQITLAPYVTCDERTEEVFVHGAAKHRLPTEMSEKDPRRGTIKRFWLDCHSPYLRLRFVEKYGVMWNLGLAVIALPEDYKHVVLPLPLPPLVTGWGASSDYPVSSSSRPALAVDETSIKETPTAGGNFSKSEHTISSLALDAHRVLGLNTWGDELSRQFRDTKRIINTTWVASGIPLEEVHAAIHGLRLMVDRGDVEWLADCKQRPLRGLEVLVNAQALVPGPDGQQLRSLFTAAADAYRSEQDKPSPRKAHTGPARIVADIPRPEGFVA